MSDGLPPPAAPAVRLLLVPLAHLDTAWALAEPWLAASCARVPDDLTPAALREMIEAETALLILIEPDGREPVAAGVTQVRDHEDGTRSCWILALGGSEARSWLKTLRLIEDGARAKGCHRIEFAGRPGWAALLPDYSAQAQYTKELV